MRNKGFLKFVGTVVATSILAACGGGGASFGGSGSGSGGTTGSTTTNPTGIPGTLVIAPATGTTGTVTVGQSIALTAKLTDTAGVAIANTTLNFSTTAGKLSTAPPAFTKTTASGITNSTGTVTVFLQAPSETGTATVSVVEPVTTISGSTNVTFTAAGATNVAITIAPTTVAPGATASVNAQVTDAGGNPVSGQLVAFGFPTAGNVSGGQFAATQVLSDVNGRATTTYQAGPAVGTDTLQASIGGGTSSISSQLNVTLGTVQIGSISLALGASSAVADGSTQTAAVATVTDSNNHALSGAKVTFSTSAGFLSPNTMSPASSATVSVTTDANGHAQAFQLSPTLAGNATITASTGGFSASQAITFIAGSVTTVATSASPITVAPNGTSTITAQLTDVHGNVAANHTVQFSVASGQFSGGGQVVSGTTNAQGVLSVSYTAPATLGNVSITATAKPEAVTGSAQVTVSSSAVPVTGVVVSAGPNSIPANGTSTSTVRATITGASGTLSNVQVNFTTTAGTFVGGGSTISANTDSNGNATVTLVSPNSSVPVTSTVTAATGGVSSTVQVTFTVSVPASVAIALTPPTVAINSQAAVSATVLDSSSNPVVGAMVNFSILTNSSGGALSSSSAVTNSSGVATTTYTAGSNVTSSSAQDTIQASTSGISNSAVLTVTNAAQVGSITLIGSAPQLLSGASAPSEGVTLTAVVRDVNNNVVPNVVVQFSAARDPNASSCGTGGALQVLNGGTTNAAGQAQAVLYTGGDSTNQLIDITAKVSAKTAALSVPETGTHITINGPSAVGLNANPKASYTITLADSGNNPISGQTLAVVSSLGNTIAAASGSSFMTGTNGQITVNYASAISGSDTLTVSPSGCASSATQATQSVLVAAETLGFIAPTVNTQIPFSASPNQSIGAAIAAGGTHYVVGDILTVQGGTSSTPAQLTVSSVNSGVITAVTVNNAGSYSVLPASPASVSGGTGSGATFTISQNVSILLVNSSGPISGAKITFSSTRGTLVSSTATTNANGIASDAINQTSSVGSAGGAVITATCTTGCSQQISASVGVQFNATMPSTVTLQASPSTVPINGTSVITATVIDANKNPVANQVVNFKLTADDSGGSLLQSQATTNSVGQAVVNYQGGATTGSQFGVVITGTVSGIGSGSSTYSILSAAVVNGGTGYIVGDVLTVNGGTSTATGQLKVAAISKSGGVITAVTVSQNGTYTIVPGNPASVTGGTGTGATFNLTEVANGTTELTVGGQSLRITLGTGNTVIALNNTQYEEPYSVLVTDAVGNPPPAGSVVTLTTNAVAYQKGVDQWNGTVWAPIYKVNCASDPGCATTSSFGCFNEDANLNGILDSGEDYNGNGVLDPGNVTSLQSSVALDTTGSGQFDIIYAKDRTYWVQVFITASIKVNGNQGTTTQVFVLPGLSSDFNNQSVSPPGVNSPYGQAAACVNPN